MADRAAPPFPPSATPPLVGRERELAALREHLAAALVGHGSLMLIGGEAGVGKTALAEDLLAEASHQGAIVLVGRCYDLSETPPYGPWAEALARAPSGEALPTLPAAAVHAERDGAAAGQDAIVRRVLAYLAALAETRPLVILLEDLHWADPASLDLLRVVGRGVADRALLLLATYRAAEQPPDHPLARLLPALVREARALGTPHSRRVHTAVRASYGSHYRRMMPRLLAALDFRSNNGAHRPLLDALDAIRRAKGEGKQYFHAALMGWTPPDGIWVPRWRCRPTTRGGVRGTG